MRWGGLESPRWGWAALAASAVLFVVLAIAVATRSYGDPLSPAELARLNAAASAANESDVARAAAGAEAAAAPEASAPVALSRPNDGPLRVLFAGDSITAGAFALTEEEAFRSRVVDQLDDDGEVEWARIGDSGLTTAQVLPEVGAGGDDRDLVVVELGTNDVPSTPLGQFQQDYPKFLDAVRDHSPDATLLCVGVWGADSAETRALDRVIRQECEARRGGFVPIGSFFADQANRGPAGTVRSSDGAVLDAFHPNNAGHAAIANAILAGLAING